MRLPFRSGAAPAAALRQPQRSSFPAMDGLTLAARYREARIGGDFFDFAVAPSGHLLILLLDIAGQRGQALDIAASVQEEFRKRGPDLFPDEELNESLALTELALDLNRTILRAAGGVRCAPGFVGCYAPRLGAIWYINAGHTPALLRSSGGTVSELAANGLPFGLFSHTTHDALVNVVEPGAALVLVSKGLVEARARKQEFGLPRVSSALQANPTANAVELCEAVLAETDRFLASAPARRLPLPGTNHKNANDRTVLTLVRGS